MIKKHEPKNMNLTICGVQFPMGGVNLEDMVFAASPILEQRSSSVVIRMIPEPVISRIYLAGKDIDSPEALKIVTDVVASNFIGSPFKNGFMVEISGGFVSSGMARSDESIKMGMLFEVTESKVIRFDNKWCWEIFYK